MKKLAIASEGHRGSPSVLKAKARGKTSSNSQPLEDENKSF